MRITVSADEKLVSQARSYAKAHQTTLNQMFRDYLTRLVCERPSVEAATEFWRTAMTQPGRSPAGWRFDRDAAHR
jgi:hypothetical protein